MKVADEAWISVALLHNENPHRPDFAVKEIKERARKEGWRLRQGFYQHVSSHCVANKPADPANHRMLYEDSRGRKRLFREGDTFHPDRQDGKVRPDVQDLPPQYRNLIGWYDSVYSRQSRRNSGNGSTGAVSPVDTESKAAAEAVSPASETAFVSSAGAFVIPEVLRQELGIREGTRLSIQKRAGELILQPITTEFVERVAGSYKANRSMVEARERDHRIER